FKRARSLNIFTEKKLLYRDKELADLRSRIENIAAGGHDPSLRKESYLKNPDELAQMRGNNSNKTSLDQDEYEQQVNLLQDEFISNRKHLEEILNGSSSNIDTDTALLTRLSELAEETKKQENKTKQTPKERFEKLQTDRRIVAVNILELNAIHHARIELEKTHYMSFEDVSSFFKMCDFEHPRGSHAILLKSDIGSRAYDEWEELTAQAYFTAYVNVSKKIEKSLNDLESQHLTGSALKNAKSDIERLLDDAHDLEKPIINAGKDNSFLKFQRKIADYSNQYKLLSADPNEKLNLYKQRVGDLTNYLENHKSTFENISSDPTKNTNDKEIEKILTESNELYEIAKGTWGKMQEKEKNEAALAGTQSDRYTAMLSIQTSYCILNFNDRWRKEEPTDVDSVNSLLEQQNKYEQTGIQSHVKENSHSSKIIDGLNNKLKELKDQAYYNAFANLNKEVKQLSDSLKNKQGDSQRIYKKIAEYRKSAGRLEQYIRESDNFNDRRLASLAKEFIALSEDCLKNITQEGFIKKTTSDIFVGSQIDITDEDNFPRNPKGCRYLNPKEINLFLGNKGKGTPPKFLTDPNSPIYKEGNFVTNFNENSWDGRITIGVKVGDLFTIYCPTGKGSAEILCYEIDKVTKSVKQVETPVLKRYPDTQFGDFMPWDADAFYGDYTMVIAKHKKLIGSDEVSQRANDLVNLKERLTNLAGIHKENSDELTQIENDRSKKINDMDVKFNHNYPQQEESVLEEQPSEKPQFNYNYPQQEESVLEQQIEEEDENKNTIISFTQRKAEGLMQAISQDDNNTVKWILNKTENAGILLKQEDKDGNTPLMHAILLKKQPIVTTLLTKIKENIEKKVETNNKHIDINSKSFSGFSGYFSYLGTKFMGWFHGGADKYVLKKFDQALQSGDASSAIKYAGILGLEESSKIDKKTEEFKKITADYELLKNSITEGVYETGYNSEGIYTLGVDRLLLAIEKTDIDRVLTQKGADGQTLLEVAISHGEEKAKDSILNHARWNCSPETIEKLRDTVKKMESKRNQENKNSNTPTNR
ncbi:MAG: ankyrin repeat domain-containing protein, partial [bacterium]